MLQCRVLYFSAKLGVILLSVIMPNVMAPFRQLSVVFGGTKTENEAQLLDVSFLLIWQKKKDFEKEKKIF